MIGRMLVAYHSKGGATETYARAVAEVLGDRGVDVDLVNLKQGIPDVGSYDVVVVGAGVRIGMVYGPLKKVLKQRTLGDNIFVFLSSGMALDNSEEAVEKYLRPIADKYGLRPLSMVSFPGCFPAKWAETEEQLNSVKPDLARRWADEILAIVQKLDT